MLSLKITVWAIIFVITNGAVFADYFKDNKILSAMAGLFAVISSYYLFGDIEKDIEHISGYKFLLYIVVGVIIVFTIIHALKSQEESESRGAVGNFFSYLFTMIFLGAVVFGGLYFLDGYIKSKDFTEEVSKEVKFKIDKNSFENIPTLETIPKKGTFETKANYDAKVNKIMTRYNNKLQEISFLAGKAIMIAYDAETQISQIKITFKDALGVTNYTKELSLKTEIAQKIFKDVNGQSNLYVRLYGTQKEELFILQIYIEDEKGKYLLFGKPLVRTFITIDGLMYQNNHKFTKTYSWNEADRYCKNLSLGGYIDWRLPKREELKKLLTKTKNRNSKGKSYYIKKEFVENMYGYVYFWTSEKKDSSSWWVVSFGYGNGSWRNGNGSSSSVLCVQ